MDLFSVVEDAHVILYVRGVYRQAKVYSRGDKVFANWGSGFVRLNRDKSTSVPSVRCIDHEGFDL